MDRKCSILRRDKSWCVMSPIYCVLYLKFTLETVAYVFGIIVYLSVTVPGLRAIAQPSTTEEMYDDRVMALRVLSAGNMIIIGCLLLILSLQVSICELWSNCLLILAVARLDKNGHIGKKPKVWQNSRRKKRKLLRLKRNNSELTLGHFWTSGYCFTPNFKFFKHLRNIYFLGNAFQ